MVKPLFCIACVLVLCSACSHKSGASDRHFHLTGEVKSLDANVHTANIDAAAIPNYMEAMSMDYPIKSAAEFNRLKVGEHIDATLNVHNDASYDLSDIHPSQPKK
jgi:Cu/Ag efflux protein CusF